jgi:hypothetical protein
MSNHDEVYARTSGATHRQNRIDEKSNLSNLSVEASSNE